MSALERFFKFDDDSEAYTSSMIKILEKIFESFDGDLAVILWDGKKIKLGNTPTGNNESSVTLIFKTPNILISFLRKKDPLSFAESYFNCEMDIEGDMNKLFSMRHAFNKLNINWMLKTKALNKINKLEKLSRSISHFKGSKFKALDTVMNHDQNECKTSIEYHYDVSNSFYELWLDPEMIYSCAYFLNANQDLAEAQSAKLDLICKKLQLQENDNFLDIGCGWGGLLIHAVKNYNVNAYGVTLSKKQYEYACKRITSEGLTGKVIIELKDYRDITKNLKFNKISSIGMFEHVGIKNQADYFKMINNLLTEDGLFLNHGITSDTEGWPNSLGQKFINRYVFPDGQLDTVSNVQRRIESASFEILDVECLRPHYVITLKNWIESLTNSHDKALTYVNESTFRIWLAYLAASKESFNNGSLGIYQILSGQHGVNRFNRPLTRAYMNLKQSRSNKSLIH